MMDKVNAILDHGLYGELMRELCSLEAGRIFCRHDIDHLLSVARIMWIRAMEEELPVDKGEVYAAALLHDIGRVAEYKNEGLQTHAQMGAKISASILSDCGFDDKSIEAITEAIAAHGRGGGSPLAELLYYADKKSRNCFFCPASAGCKWPEEKKNREVSE